MRMKLKGVLKEAKPDDVDYKYYVSDIILPALLQRKAVSVGKHLAGLPDGGVQPREPQSDLERDLKAAYDALDPADFEHLRTTAKFYDYLDDLADALIDSGKNLKRALSQRN